MNFPILCGSHESSQQVLPNPLRITQKSFEKIGKIDDFLNYDVKKFNMNIFHSFHFFLLREKTEIALRALKMQSINKRALITLPTHATPYEIV